MTEEIRASVCSPATQLGEHILKYKPIDYIFEGIKQPRLAMMKGQTDMDCL